MLLIALVKFLLCNSDLERGYIKDQKISITLIQVNTLLNENEN